MNALGCIIIQAHDQPRFLQAGFGVSWCWCPGRLARSVINLGSKEAKPPRSRWRLCLGRPRAGDKEKLLWVLMTPPKSRLGSAPSFPSDDQHWPLAFLTLFPFRAAGLLCPDRHLLQLPVKGIQIGRTLLLDLRDCVTHGWGFLRFVGSLRRCRNVIGITMVWRRSFGRRCRETSTLSSTPPL